MRHTVLVFLVVLAVSTAAVCLADVNPAGLADTQQLNHGPYADPGNSISSISLEERVRYGPFYDPDGHL